MSLFLSSLIIHSTRWKSSDDIKHWTINPLSATITHTSIHASKSSSSLSIVPAWSLSIYPKEMNTQIDAFVPMMIVYHQRRDSFFCLCDQKRKEAWTHRRENWAGNLVSFFARKSPSWCSSRSMQINTTVIISCSSHAFEGENQSEKTHGESEWLAQLRRLHEAKNHAWEGVWFWFSWRIHRSTIPVSTVSLEYWELIIWQEKHTSTKIQPITSENSNEKNQNNNSKAPERTIEIEGHIEKKTFPVQNTQTIRMTFLPVVCIGHEGLIGNETILASLQCD